MEERNITIKDCRYVDNTILNAPINTTLEFIEKNNIDYVACGNDYTKEQIEIFFPLLKENRKLYLFDYTKNISTTEILKRLKEQLKCETC